MDDHDKNKADETEHVAGGHDTTGSGSLERTGGSLQPLKNIALTSAEGVDTARGGEATQGPQAKRRRRSVCVDIGSPITDHNGYLLRNRPGSDVPVGPMEALLLSKGLGARELAILKATERLGVVTTEQVGRAFFNSPRSAYNRLLLLRYRRFVARLGVDVATVRLAIPSPHAGDRRPGMNPAYALDWNGYYLLTAHHGYRADNWRAATAAAVTSRVGHELGVSDVWSYLVAAARATQEMETQAAGQATGRYRLSIGFLNERESVLSVGSGAGLRSIGAAPAGVAFQGRRGRAGVKGKVLIQPDGLFVIGARESRATGSLKAQLGAQASGQTGTPRGQQGKEVQQGHLGQLGKEGQRGTATGSPNPRWNPTLHSWHPSLLGSVPSPGEWAAGVASGDEGDMLYRMLLLEMETGSNDLVDVARKVGGYNRLVQGHRQAFHMAYGPSPRVLVVVRTDAQIEGQARTWYNYCRIGGETSVLLTSLQLLARIYRRGRLALVSEPCWLDIMAPPERRWKTLAASLDLA